MTSGRTVSGSAGDVELRALERLPARLRGSGTGRHGACARRPRIAEPDPHDHMVDGVGLHALESDDVIDRQVGHDDVVQDHEDLDRVGLRPDDAPYPSYRLLDGGLGDRCPDHFGLRLP